MIEQIESIRNFGIFRDLSWDNNLPGFGKLNLIYGWNYSGKTTLSRIFQAIERRKVTDEYAQGSFAIKLANGSRFSSSNLQDGPTVRVFNCDYVAANFQTEYSAPAMFILGEENAASKVRLDQLNKRLGQVRTVSINYSSQQQTIKDRVDSASTDKARDVRHLLGDPNFDRTRLNQCITEIRADPVAYTLSEDVVQSRIWTLRSGDQYGSLATISEGLPDMATAVERVNGLLQQMASNLAIERLRQNPRIGSWVLEGMGLHKDAAVCEFCGGPLSNERLIELNGHFSKEYKKLVGTLKDVIENLQGYEFLPRIHDEMRILPEFRSKFAATKEAMTEWAGWAADLRDDLVESLRRKQTAIESKQT